ncbi:MAG: zinc-ribbon domain-containing protein [Coriobacteriaceae bacterium]|nr:zinc-ribbon domain-containing protein [Coriobacteriaceae bacterium]
MNGTNCPNCNAPVDPYDRFCESCGTLLTTSKATASETPVAGTESVEQQQAASADVASPAEATPFDPSSPAAVAAPFAAGASAAYGSAAAEPDGSPYAKAVDYAHGNGTPFEAQPQQQSYGEATYASPTYAAPTYAAPAAPTAPYASASAAVAPGAAFGLSITSLVLGILGIISFGVMFFLGFVGIILGIIALVMRSGYRKRGLYDSHSGATLGLSIAGIITNLLALIMLAAIVIVGVAVYENEDLYDEIMTDEQIEQLIEDQEQELSELEEELTEELDAQSGKQNA